MTTITFGRWQISKVKCLAGKKKPRKYTARTGGFHTPVKMISAERRSPWIGTIPFSKWLGIHPQTVRAVRKLKNGPWQQGIHYRQTGITGRGPLQWHRELAEKAFTEFHRTPAMVVETFSRATNPTLR